MGVLDGILGLFRAKGSIALEEAPAAGEARAASRALIGALREAQPREVRAASTREHLDAVIDRARLEAFLAILAKTLGEPCKPFGARGKFVRGLAEQVDDMGGVERSQCLFLRRFEDDHVAFAALWPWGDARSVTLKVGVFPNPLPPSTPRDAPGASGT